MMDLAGIFQESINYQKTMNNEHSTIALRAAQQIKQLSGIGKFDIGVVLGSGLTPVNTWFEHSIHIDFETIEGLPQSSVHGHNNYFIAGEIDGIHVLVQCGRFHWYEGLDMSLLLLPISIFGALAIPKLMITNAAGAINTTFSPGDFMLITDHIHTLGKNPNVGAEIANPGAFFTDLHKPYSKLWNQQLLQLVDEMDIKLHAGVYCHSPGPAYETPSEINMMKFMGADAIGMSTTAEVIYAKSLSMEVIGISCISNMAAGIETNQLTHENVIRVTKSMEQQFSTLMKAIISQSKKKVNH